MSGSRLGRGRVGRLALYGGCLIIFVIFVYLYRACSIEMTRLHELHVQCAHQQEALAAQLQVIYEYKVRLEKSLQEEKNTNQALKQELQQRVSREKSLRDKDKNNVEVMQRYNALQQKYNILQSEKNDIQEECTKKQKQALEETNRLESTLTDFRSETSRAQEDKKKSMENLKTKFFTIQKNYTKLEDEYNNLVKDSISSKSTLLHLEKQVFQLKRELEQAKKSITSSDYVVNHPAVQEKEDQDKRLHSANDQVARPSQQQQQQVSRPSKDDDNPPPLPAPRDHQAIGDTLNEKNEKIDKNDGRLPNEQISDVGFAQMDGNIVPVGPNDLKDQQNNLPLPMPYQEDSRKKEKRNENVGEEPPQPEEPVLSQDSDVLRKPNEKSSSNGPKLVPIQPQRSDKETRSGNRGHIESPNEVDELQDLKEKNASTHTVNSIPGVNLESSTKASVASVSPEKSSLTAGKTKVKLPIGVVPIPIIIDPKLENDEKKRDEKRRNQAAEQNSLVKDLNVENYNKEKAKELDIGNLDLLAHQPAGNRHVDQGNGGLLRVQPGVQEIGDEPNHLERLAGLEGVAQQGPDVGEDQYENDEFYREPQPKNNDLRIEEEEDAGEDEDDQLDYPNNNLKHEKQE